MNGTPVLLPEPWVTPGLGPLLLPLLLGGVVVPVLALLVVRGTRGWHPRFHHRVLTSALLVVAGSLAVTGARAMDRAGLLSPAPEPGGIWIETPAPGDGATPPALPRDALPGSDGVGPATEPGPLPLTLASVWVLGALLLLGRLALRHRRLARWGRSAPALDHPEAPALLAALEPHRRRRPRLVSAPEGSGAFAWGLLRHRVALDRTTASLPAAELRAVLVHELTHLRNRDPAWTLLARSLAALLWPLIPVWLLGQRLARVSEAAADAAVVEDGTSRGRYARLLHAAAERRMVHTPLPVPYLGESEMVERLRRLAAGGPGRQRGAGPLAGWAARGAALALLLALSGTGEREPQAFFVGEDGTVTVLGEDAGP